MVVQELQVHQVLRVLKDPQVVMGLKVHKE
jgi:hypothetical protein